MEHPKVVSHEQWLAARRQLLAEEKEFTRLRDRLSQQRRDLPWERVDKDYVFDGPGGRETLSQLFDGKHQLAVYHFMLGPGWKEGCKSCSYWADNFNGIDMHLRQRDVSFLAISRAPWPEIEAFKKAHGMDIQMGIVLRERLQLRLLRVVTARRSGVWESRLQLRADPGDDGGTARHQRILQG